MNAISNAYSGLNAAQNRSAATANNLANVNTPGYRSQRANTSTGPNGQGAAVDSVSISREMGSLRATGNPLDLAIAGNGFLMAQGPGGEPTFSRDGSLSVGPEGNLVNSQGQAIAPGIQVPDNAESLSVASDGTVSATVDGEQQELGQIELANFANPEGLSRQGGNQAVATNASGEPQIGAPGTGGRGQIVSGFLEGSNVDLVTESVNMINDANSFSANATMVRTADEMQRTTIDLVG